MYLEFWIIYIYIYILAGKIICTVRVTSIEFSTFKIPIIILIEKKKFLYFQRMKQKFKANELVYNE